LKYPKYVQVSYDAPDEWWDPKSGMWFRKSDGIIELKDYLDGSNIVKYVRFNYLIDVTSLAEPKEQEAEKLPLYVEQTPAQLLQQPEKDETAIAEVEEEVKEEKPKCPFCGKECVPKGLPNHIRFCKQNPNRKEKGE
jgi:hypothetical protein